MNEARMCQLRALLDEKLGKVESAKPKLTIVKEPAPVKEPAFERPAIFALGPMEARRRAAQG
jgi:hypothetical protein